MDFKYCPKCKGGLKRIADNLSVCQNCGFHFYENPAPANSVIIENEKGEILLVKRKLDPQKGMYDLPGGFVDVGENLEESINREIEEEIGVKVENFEYIGSGIDEYLYKGHKFPILGLSFRAKVKSGKLKPGDDVSSIEFFPKNKIPFEKIAFESIKKVLRIYVSRVSKQVNR